MNASGTVSLGDHVITAGLPLAGQRVMLRFDGLLAHIVSGGTVVRTVACPSPSLLAPGCAAHAAAQLNPRNCPNLCTSDGGYRSAVRS